MANIPLKSIKFPDLDDTYTVPSNAGELAYNKSATYPADTVGKALQNIGDSSAPAILETAQGSIASFDDGADNIPVKDLVAEIVPLQSGSGDPSPSNVRAISGWSEANISVSGINVWDEEWEEGVYSDVTGAKSYASNRIRSKNKIKVSPNAVYYIKCSSTMTVYGYDSLGNYLRVILFAQNQTLTVPSDVSYITFNMGVNSGATYNNDISINYPSADQDYHTYNGEVHTISFASAGTVYGGKLDVTSGVLTVTDANIASYNGEALPSTWISDRDVYAIGTTPTTGAQVVYKLATPQTYQLTPTEVKTLLKNNNIWADTGDVTVEYVADTKTFIENLVNA